MIGDMHKETVGRPIEKNSRTLHPDRPAGRVVLPVIGRNGVARHCWEIIASPDNNLHGTCEECYAHFVQRDCWTLWALRDAGHKPCCQKLDDCTKCPVLLHQIAPRPNEMVQMQAQVPAKQVQPPGRAKQVCRYLEVIDLLVSRESTQYLSAVSRAVQARSSTFRCRLRGVHLDVGYVGDMCVSRHVQDCVFLDEAHPQVSVQRAPVHDAVRKEPYVAAQPEYTSVGSGDAGKV